MTSRFKAIFVSITVLSLTLGSCGTIKLGGSGEKNTEQPTEVSGGFGLACTSADLQDDSERSEISCALADADGQIYKNSPDLKLHVTVKLSDELIPHVMQPENASSSFIFTALRSDMSKIQIIAVITKSSTSTNGSAPDISDGLESLSWNLGDVVHAQSSPQENTASRFIKHEVKVRNRNKIMLEDKQDKLFLSWYKGKEVFNEAKEKCDEHDTEFSSRRLSNWRLPTEDEIVSVSIGQISRVDGWITDVNMTAQFWTSTKRSKKNIARSLSYPSFMREINSISSYSVLCVHEIDF